MMDKNADCGSTAAGEFAGVSTGLVELLEHAPGAVGGKFIPRQAAEAARNGRRGRLSRFQVELPSRRWLAVGIIGGED